MELLENSPWQHGWEALDLKNQIPTIIAYVGRFREHPLMKPHCVKREYNNNPVIFLQKIREHYFDMAPCMMVVFVVKSREEFMNNPWWMLFMHQAIEN